MKIGGVITEFNPFHNGHAALCAGARTQGVTHLIAVMSGNFVQRGGLAITDKRVRAACALACGVDLVLELPLPWAMSGAQVFARGGVGLLAACGCVDVLTFGSESGLLEPLSTLAALIDSPGVEARMREILPQGVTYAKARELAAREVLGDELAGRLSSPNDLLGIEYLRAAREAGWQPEVSVIKRLGVGHDATNPNQEYASASYLRSVADQGLGALRQYIPAACFELLQEAERKGLYPAGRQALEGAILAHLRRLSREELARLPDISEGLENRLHSAIRTSTGIDELAQATKTKRYTMARVRRLIFSAFLGLTKEDALGTPPYLRVIGMNKRGEEILAKMKETATLPLSSSLARLSELSRRAGEIAALEERSTDLYALALPTPQPCGYEKWAKVVTAK